MRLQLTVTIAITVFGHSNVVVLNARLMFHLTIVVVRLAITTAHAPQRLIAILVDAVAWTRADSVVVGVNFADLVEIAFGFPTLSFSVCLEKKKYQ